MLPLVLLACSEPIRPTAPTAPILEPATAPAEGLAPRLFDAAGLREGFVLGTRIRMRIEAAGAPPIEEEWIVTAHDATGCTIHTVTRDAATGTLLKEEDGTSTWAELESHASFPAAATTFVDTTTTVPAGTFESRRYIVREADGTSKVFHFATTLPGPPIRMEITKDGAQLLSLTMLERTAPTIE